MKFEWADEDCKTIRLTLTIMEAIHIKNLAAKQRVSDMETEQAVTIYKLYTVLKYGDGK